MSLWPNNFPAGPPTRSSANSIRYLPPRPHGRIVARRYVRSSRKARVRSVSVVERRRHAHAVRSLAAGNLRGAVCQRDERLERRVILDRVQFWFSEG
jgi:hypothetical protein